LHKDRDSGTGSGPGQLPPEILCIQWLQWLGLRPRTTVCHLLRSLVLQIKQKTKIHHVPSRKPESGVE